jgi:RHS repeat-associated protein
VYLPYGTEATAFNQDQERMKFTGHERDLADPTSPADDLDYMHARFANPLTGRFLAIDIATGKPQAPQSWNRYAYAQGNPVRFVDPNGKDLMDAINGFANAVGSDFLLGAGRQSGGNTDFQRGQKIGDAVATVLAIDEATAGGVVGLSALACEAGSFGGCTPLAAPAAVGAGVAVVHGAAVAVTASQNMARGVSLMESKGGKAGGEEGPKAGDLKVLSKDQLKELGIDDPEAFKQDIVGKGSRSKFNVAVDPAGNLYLVTAKKGAGPAVNTFTNVSDLRPPG